jgi:hypothetical protein
MVRRVVRSSKTSIGKAKLPSLVILKEGPVKSLKPAVEGRLQARERKTLVAMARVLVGK